MKKELLISLLFFFTLAQTSFSQYVNVDFEPGGLGDAWTWVTSQNGSNPPLQFVPNPSATGINTSVTSAEFIAEAAGQPWALCFADIPAFTFDATNNIVKIMVYKTVASPVHIKFEGASAPIELIANNTLLNQWEELTYDFSSVIGNTYSRIVVIPDFQARTSDNVIFFDNIQIPDSNTAPPAVPTVAAPSPSSDVCAISIFSDALTDVAGTDFDPFWGQSTDATVVPIAGNNTLQYMNLNYQGTQFGSNQDVSAYEFLHVDFWTDNSTDIGFYLISPGNEIEYDLTPSINAGQWVSVDIPLSSFVPPVDLTDVFQFKVDGNGNVWFDNLYFHGGTSANVTLPAAGTATSITCVSSCDDGPWTYYEDPVNPGIYLLAIEWDASGTGNNAAAKSGAQVTIDVAAAPTMVDDGTYATWSMARYWNVTPGAAVVDPVNVKFFYDAAELTTITNAMNNDGRAVDGVDWFKTTAVDFDPATHVTAQMITGNPVVLTDMNTAGATENGVLYAQFDAIMSFSGGTATAGVDGTTLPVSLSDFNAKVLDNSVELSWATTVETNNDYFQIERSSNGRAFEMIDRVEGANNSVTLKNYTSIDRNPNTGDNYYRIKQVDLNGAFTYSDIVLVEMLSRNTMRMYPMPVSNQLTIDYTSSQTEQASIMLVDALGVLVSQTNLTAVPGDNSFTIDVTTIPAGSYFVIMQFDTNRIIRNIIKK